MQDKRPTYKKLEKLHQHELDRLSKRKAELDDQIKTFNYLITQLEREAEDEKAKAHTMPELNGFLGSYLKQNEARRVEFGQALQRLERQVDELQDLIADAFSELKQMDIAHSQEDERISEDMARNAQKELDDMAGMRHKKD